MIEMFDVLPMFVGIALLAGSVGWALGARFGYQDRLRDYFAANALAGIYENKTLLTDSAAELAYEQADEMLRVRLHHL